MSLKTETTNIQAFFILWCILFLNSNMKWQRIRGKSKLEDLSEIKIIFRGFVVLKKPRSQNVHISQGIDVKNAKKK